MERRSRINPVSPKKRKRSGKVGHCGIVRLYGPDLEALRSEVFDRDKGRCQWPVGAGICGKVLIYEAGYRDSMHMAHRKNKRNNGDLIGNVRALCGTHHAYEHAGGKPCPSKRGASTGQPQSSPSQSL